LADNIGTVRDVIDNSGNVEIHREYNSFGKIVAETNPNAVDFLMAHTGRPLDKFTEDQNHSARWYDVDTGRWNSEDWIWDDSNSYRYCGNTPTSFTDPSGLGKLRAIRGLEDVLFDKDTAEYVLKNGKRITVRNAKFINSHVSLDDLDALTKVSKDRLARLRKKFPNGVSVRYNGIGQPNLSPLKEAKVRIAKPNAWNYRKTPWEELAKRYPETYARLWPNKADYEWHHAMDNSLQLIDKDLHTAFQHTGRKSIMKKLTTVGGTLLLMIPGAEAMADGEFGKAAKDAAEEVTPGVSGAKFGAEIIGWFYESAHDQLHGEKAQEENRKWKKEFWD